MTTTAPSTAPTLASLLELTTKAGRKAYWNVAPRYTCGSPAMVSMAVAVRIALEEYEFRETSLSGVYGDELKARAETLGLANIAYARWEAKGKVWRLDLLTGETFIEPKELNWDERQQLRSWRAQAAYHAKCGEKPPFAQQMAELEARLALHRQPLGDW